MASSTTPWWWSTPLRQICTAHPGRRPSGPGRVGESWLKVGLLSTGPKGAAPGAEQQGGLLVSPAGQKLGQRSVAAVDDDLSPGAGDNVPRPLQSFGPAGGMQAVEFGVRSFDFPPSVGVGDDDSVDGSGHGVPPVRVRELSRSRDPSSTGSRPLGWTRGTCGGPGPRQRRQVSPSCLRPRQLAVRVPRGSAVIMNGLLRRGEECGARSVMKITVIACTVGTGQARGWRTWRVQLPGTARRSVVWVLRGEHIQAVASLNVLAP
jgi:hypothetical protein